MFFNYTNELISLLNPHIIILSGSSTHKFDLKSSSLIIKMLHYAHRGGKQKERIELNRVKKLIDRF